ncbi:MAG: pyridoxal 5'-phosphate synthase glutaminase subunit PdxT [FCB group bacterium]|nr:pyridoxal 5'-phosphate synthase glutaminase subunit PdxT [FCB group bacterium]
MKIGVLALQGDFEKHSLLLEQLGITPVRIRYPHDLDTVEGLVFPGGESTTLMHLIEQNAFRTPLSEFAASHPVLGTCAGLILMATSVDDSRINPLGLLDIDARRNAYGRQVFSFTDQIQLTHFPDQRVSATFIRAPKITRIGTGIEILATWKNEPVGVMSGNHMALSFHPELDGYSGFHKYLFLS